MRASALKAGWTSHRPIPLSHFRRRRCWLGLPRSKKTRRVAQMMPFRIGADASCTDGACGQVSRIIVNPADREVTHLVVDPKHRRGPGRLVPVDLADATTGQIRLGCTLALVFHEAWLLSGAPKRKNAPELG